MKGNLVLEAKGWPCSLEECPVGLFVSVTFADNVPRGTLGFKTGKGCVHAKEGEEPRVLTDKGEVWVGSGDPKHARTFMVQPVRYRWE